MKKQKLIEYLNNYFTKFGNQNIIDKYFIEHELVISVYDINRNRRTGKIQIFIDSDPIRLEHTIEDDSGNTVYLAEVVWEELQVALSYIGIDIFTVKTHFNKRSLDDGLPFDENEVSENVKIRTFKDNTNSEELKWHRDREDRIVEVIENNNWFLQMDNEIPKKLIKGKRYYIPEGEYHRVIKGDGNLVIKVTLNKIIK
jgi:hypothetical protein